VKARSSNGVKMQPNLNGRPSDAIDGNELRRAHCVVKLSPDGIGCVGEVCWNAFCGTGFSSISSVG
jgi:hypothetical protein